MENGMFKHVLNTWIIDSLSVNVGKYTSPMDRIRYEDPKNIPKWNEV